MGADNLSEADFFSALCRPGCGQIHEVDASDEKDEKSDRRKNVDQPDIASSLMEMNFGHRLEVDF